MIQIRDQITPKWYQFGLAVGISKETLDEFSNFPPEECIVEMSDLWLRTNERAVTWRDVADALKEIGCHRLAEKILKVYKTGETFNVGMDWLNWYYDIAIIIIISSLIPRPCNIITIIIL